MGPGSGINGKFQHFAELSAELIWIAVSFVGAATLSR